MANTKITTSVIADGAITSAKLDTDISVSGTVTADGLTVDGDATISSNTGNSLTLNRPDGAGSPNILFQSNGTQTARLVTNASNDIVFERGTTDALKIEGSTGDISFYEDTGTTAKLFWDASAESLGIGTTSPSELLSLSSTNPRISLNDSDNAGTASTGLIEFDATDGRSGYIGMSGGQLILFADTTSDQIIKFVNGSGESMRIDSSGTLLVGTTDDAHFGGSTNSGLAVYSSGITGISRSAGTVLYVNRQTSDGDIITFRKDGSLVGRIGVEGAALTLGDDGAGLQFLGSENKIRPFDMGTNSASNGVVDLGRSNAKFKDLYLSGAIKMDSDLDDYEEGTFTVGFTGAAISAGNTTGHYTKIGRVVYYSYYSTASTISNASGVAELTGLPFTVKSGVTYYQPFYTAHNTFFGNSTSIGVEGYPNVSATSLRFIERGTTNNVTFVNGVTRFLMVAGFYITDA